MGPLLKLLGFALLLGLSTAKPTYVLVAPKILKTDGNQTFCITLEGLQGKANMTLKLTDETGTVYASVQHTFSDEDLATADCKDLAIPSRMPELDKVHVHLLITSESEESWVIDEVKEVPVAKMHKIPIVQTEAELYRPRELVKFRVFNLDHRLFPIAQPISRVRVEDPSGKTAAEWKDAETTQGIHHFEFEVPEEAAEGTWKISVEQTGNDEYVERFEVRKLDLSRFHVLLQTPDAIYKNRRDDASNQEIHIGISSRRDDNTPVEGSWKAVVEVETGKRMWFGQSMKSKEVTNRLEGELSGGFSKLVLDGSSLGLNQHRENEYRIVYVTVTVTDKETGTSITESWTTKVQYGGYDVSFTPETFKHGLPFNGVGRLGARDGKSISGKKIQICHEPIYVKSEKDDQGSKSSPTCFERTVDHTGMFTLDITPTDANVTSYAVSVDVFAEDSSIMLRQHFSIQAYYSPSNSFITILEPPSPSPCDNEINFKIQYTTTQEKMFNIYFMAYSGGETFDAGMHVASFFPSGFGSSKTINSTPYWDENTNQWKTKWIAEELLQIVNLPKFPTAASVLIYYVREDGEVVTADFRFDTKRCNSVEVQSSMEDRKFSKLKIKGDKNAVCGLAFFEVPNSHSSCSNYDFPKSDVFDRAMSNRIPPNYPPFTKTRNDLYCGEPAQPVPNPGEEEPRYVNIHTSPYLDAITALDEAGLLVMSNLKFETRPCIQEKYYPDDEVYDSPPVSGNPGEKSHRINKRHINLDDGQLKRTLPKGNQLITLDEFGEGSVVVPVGKRSSVPTEVLCVSAENGLSYSRLIDVVSNVFCN